MIKAGTIEVGTAYTNLGSSLVEAQGSGSKFASSKTVRNGLLTNGAAVVVYVAFDTADDAFSIQLQPGESLPFEDLNTSRVYVKTASSSGAVRIHGEA